MADSGGEAFVGRAHELARLGAALATASAGQGGVVMLSGEPGIGKTRTAEELARWASADGTEVLVGRCYEGEGAPAFWPWVQVLRSYAAGRTAERLAAELGVGAPDVAAVVPEIRTLLPDVGAPPAVEPEQARFRFFDGVTTCLRRAATTRPIVLVLDDLHGADKPSLLLLQFLARELRASRVLVVGAHREVALGPEHPLAQTLGELVRERVVERLELGGLSVGEVAELIGSVVGVPPAADVAAAVHERTSGNPLYVTEIARAAVGAGGITAAVPMEVPESVRVAIARRLGSLSAECRELLVLAALCGREFRSDALARASELGTARVLELLDEAVLARIVGPVAGDATRWRFTHALFGESLAQAPGVARRAALHHRAAAALASDPRAEEMVAEVAHHWLAAGAGGEPEQAVAWCCRAGDRALGLLAYEEAARLYEMGLTALGWLAAPDEPRTADVLLALGEAHKRAGEIATAKAAFLRAAEIGRRLRSAELLTRAALGYAPVFGLAERPEPDPALTALLEEAIAAWEGRDSGLHACALVRVAAMLFFGDAARREELVRQALAMARRVGDPATLRFVLARRLFASMLLDELDERFALATELIESAERAGDLESVAHGRMSYAGIVLARGDISGFARNTQALSRLASETREPCWCWLAAVHGAALATIEGRFDEAERAMNEALMIGRTALPWSAPAYFVFQRLVLHVLWGRSSDALSAYRAVADGVPDPRVWVALAWADAALGNGDEARRIIDRVLPQVIDGPREAMRLASLGFLAPACASLGDAASAATLYEELSPYASMWVMFGDGGGSLGPVTLYLGVLARTLGRLEEAVGHLERALDVTLREGAHPLVARIRYEYAVTLRTRGAAGDAERADKLLAEARATADRLGMEGLSRSIAKLEMPDREGSPAGPCVFRREGDVWTIAYEGQTVRLRDTRGLQYLAQLLRTPGREFHASELVGTNGGHRNGNGAGVAAEMRVTRDLGDAGPVLDRRARAAYRERLGELREALEEAERLNDLGRAERARAEIAALRAELGAAGRGKRAASHAERARLTVTKGIGAALGRIADTHPALGAHLAATVRRGYFCAYVPDPRRSISWVS